jgi:hypothetical protein
LNTSAREREELYYLESCSSFVDSAQYPAEHEHDILNALRLLHDEGTYRDNKIDESFGRSGKIEFLNTIREKIKKRKK